ncbi:MAG: universal stress protein [Bacteroidota bacterium]
MSKILVPTDFSKGSKHALIYASKIANNISADITLLWVDNYDSTTSLTLDLQSTIKKEAQEELAEMIIEGKASAPSIKFNSKLKSGKVFREVIAFASTDKTTLIVLSTHGSSGFEDYWIGSNAIRMISATKCPVISVKQMYEFSDKPISRILVPIDHTSNTLDKLPSIIDFATKFDAEINILAIYTTSLKTLKTKVDNAATTAQKMIAKAKLSFSFDTLKTENISSDLLKFVETSSIDLIAIMTEQNRNEENSIIDSIAQQIINQSPIPVLSIR